MNTKKQNSPRQAAKPPYQVDDSVYQRYDPKNSVFNRGIREPQFAERLDHVKPMYQPGDPGYSHIDSALVSGAVFGAVYNGTNVPFFGTHAGMLSFENQTIDAPHGPVFQGRWDPSQFSGEEVAAVVKKAARLFGASWVGICQLDERWLYKDYFDLFTGQGAPILVKEMEKVTLPPGQVTPEEATLKITASFKEMEAGQFKAFVMDVLETTDPATLPTNLPSAGMVRLFPANQIKAKLSTFSAFPTGLLRAFAKKLGLGFEIANIEMGASERPQYLSDGTFVIPKAMKTVITLAFEMDYDLIAAGPTQQSDVTVQYGYSRMATTAAPLARFLMGLGYHAIPCGNNTALNIPLAIDAGLGELGRNGLLITPEFGPRVRIGKVITDLPMAYDQPLRFGVKEFCDNCGKCAKACPVQAISHGPQTDKPVNISTNPGVMKWPINAEKCYMSWMMHGSSCSMCIKVCPFNKPNSWLHKAARSVVRAKNGALDKLFVQLDDALGYGSSKPKVGLLRAR